MAGPLRNECLNKFKLPVSSYTCASISELPFYIFTLRALTKKYLLGLNTLFILYANHSQFIIYEKGLKHLVLRIRPLSKWGSGSQPYRKSSPNFFIWGVPHRSYQESETVGTIFGIRLVIISWLKGQQINSDSQYVRFWTPNIKKNVNSYFKSLDYNIKIII